MKSLIVMIIVLAITSLAYYFFIAKQGKTKTQSLDATSHEQTGSNMSSDNAVGDKTKYSGELLAGSASPILDFEKTDYQNAIATDKLIVLYFYANWCPICKAEFPLMQSAFNDLTSENVIGFRVNYNDSDTDSGETALAKQFGVAYQHTKVFVKNKERVLKAPDGWDENRYLSEINKYLVTNP